MVDTILVILIVAAAVFFLGYRYIFKKSGGCSCGTGACCKGKSREKSCGCQK